MTPRACAYCGNPSTSVRRFAKRFCSEEHLRKYLEREASWKGVNDMGNVGGPGC